MKAKAFFDKATWTVSYVAYDEKSRDAIIIDPVLDFDPLSWSTSKKHLDEMEAWVKDKGLKVHAVVDTHAHADHLSGIAEIKRRFNVPMGMGSRIVDVQSTFKEIFNFGDEHKTDGSQFDFLLDDGEEKRFGTLTLKALHTPGHTPACTSYVIDDAVFVGDALLMPDSGTGRCDFPKGSAEDLYDSVMSKLYTLPDDTRVFINHDYQPGGRDLAWETTIGEQKAKNVRIQAKTSKADFVASRAERDASLSPPKLILQSVQINAFGADLPPPEENGMRYVKIPLNLLG